MRLFDRFPVRFVAPNAVTCAGLVTGLASIRTSLTATSAEGFRSAAWLVLYAVLLDKLDGTVARRLKASSEIGVQLDSFSDFVTFGIAPAALVTCAVPWALPAWRDDHSNTLLLAIGAIYVLAAALRLAKFNVTTGAIGPRFFLGLPSTSSGGLIASGFLTFYELGLGVDALAYFVGALALNAVLMVSNLPMPKLHISANPLIRVLQVLLVLSVYVLVPLHRFPTFVFSCAMVYTIGGFIYGLTVGDKVLQEPEEPDEADGPEQQAPTAR